MHWVSFVMTFPLLENKRFDGNGLARFIGMESALMLYKPDWFLAENVGGLASANKGKHLVSFSKT